MKIAHLIITHANPAHLMRLVGRLAHEQADFYVHVDAKTDITPFLPAAERANVYFIKKREQVIWGGYSIVQATLNGFEQILASGKDYSYINLLSGQDYPIKSTEYIHDFLAKNQGKIYMEFQSVYDEWQEAISRITEYHLTNYQFPGNYRAQTLMNTVLPKRKLPKGFIPVGRSQWFTASRESVAYIVQYIKEHAWISRFFRLSWAPDEMIFQTILYNSPLKQHMVNRNMMYTDWSNGTPSPKVLTMKDAGKLSASDKLFARKFNQDNDPEILDYLDKL